MATVRRVVAVCNYALAGIAAVILLLLLISVCFATISRYAFHEPFAFLVDLGGYSLVFVAFLSAPWLMAHHGHVQIDFLITKVSLRGQNYWNAAIQFVTAAVAVAIAYPATQLLVDFIGRDRVMQDSLKTPQWLLLLPIVIGAVFVAIQAIINGIDYVKSARTGRVDERPQTETPYEPRADV